LPPPLFTTLRSTYFRLAGRALLRLADSSLSFPWSILIHNDNVADVELPYALGLGAGHDLGEIADRLNSLAERCCQGNDLRSAFAACLARHESAHAIVQRVGLSQR